MAGRLSNVVGRSVASSLRLRSGMGLPVGKHIVPNKPLPVNDELVWDNGTPFPEPCIDRIADTVEKYEALGFLHHWEPCLCGMIKPLRFPLHQKFILMTTCGWSLVENHRQMSVSIHVFIVMMCLLFCPYVCSLKLRAVRNNEDDSLFHC